MSSKTKEQATLFLQKIENMIKVNIEQLRNLISAFDQLDETQKTKIFKAEIRLIQFLQFRFDNTQQTKLIQQPFSKEDYNKLYQFQECQLCCSSLQKKLSQMVQMIQQLNSENYLQEIEVDRKTNQLTNIGQDGQYYGYLLKGQPNGRGILMTGHTISNGYFLGGEFVSGQIIFIGNCGNIHTHMQQMPGEVPVCSHHNQDYPNRFFHVLQQPLTMILETDQELFDLLQYNQEQFIQDFNNNNYQIQSIPDMKYKEVETQQYFGQSLINLKTKVSFRHGLGLYLNQMKRVFALGIWHLDKLKWGELVCIQSNKKIKAYGKIEEQYQQYLI